MEIKLNYFELFVMYLPFQLTFTAILLLFCHDERAQRIIPTAAFYALEELLRVSVYASTHFLIHLSCLSYGPPFAYQFAPFIAVRLMNSCTFCKRVKRVRMCVGYGCGFIGVCRCGCKGDEL